MRIVLILLSFFAAGCTTLGVDNAQARSSLNYGPPEYIRLCVLQDKTLGNAETTSLINAIRRDMTPFGLNVQIPWVKPWRRQGFDYMEILEAVVKAHPLTDECDRIAAFVGRDAADILWGALLMPEVLGAVETATRTRGFMVAEFGSLNQVFSSPQSVASHEFFHMLGCEHDLTMAACYQQITQLKAQTRAVRASGINMVPGRLQDGRYIANRQAIDTLLQRVVWK